MLCTSIPVVVSTTITTSPICSECGTMRKSGVKTCCAKGGSWFGKCGSADDANVGHTWYEGVQVCKARQSRVAVGQQLRASRPRSNTHSNGIDKGVDSKAIVVAAHKIKSTTLRRSPSDLSITPSQYNYDVATSTSKAIILGNIANAHPSTILSINERIIPRGDKTKIKSTHTLSGVMHVIPTDDTSDSASIGTRKSEMILRIITHINVVLIIISW